MIWTLFINEKNFELLEEELNICAFEFTTEQKGNRIRINIECGSIKEIKFLAQEYKDKKFIKSIVKVYEEIIN